MRLRSLILLTVAALCVAGCARQPKTVAVAPASDLDALMYGLPPAPSRTAVRVAQVVPVAPATPVRAYVEPIEGGPYTLDSGDKLRIVVFGQDTLSNTYAVDANGNVSFPLIGLVPARGLTSNALGASIAGRLKQSFIRDPSVAVEIETYRPFFILGEVAFPGQYPYVAKMTVQTAVAIAGGFTPRALRDEVKVTRKIGGMPERFKLPLDYQLRPGDTVTVGERWF